MFAPGGERVGFPERRRRTSAPGSARPGFRSRPPRSPRSGRTTCPRSPSSPPCSTGPGLGSSRARRAANPWPIMPPHRQADKHAAADPQTVPAAPRYPRPSRPTHRVLAGRTTGRGRACRTGSAGAPTAGARPRRPRLAGPCPANWRTPPAGRPGSPSSRQYSAASGSTATRMKLHTPKRRAQPQQRTALIPPMRRNCRRKNVRIIVPKSAGMGVSHPRASGTPNPFLLPTHLSRRFTRDCLVGNNK